MKINIREQKNAAKKFSQKWLNRGNERQDSQTFWLELLQNVFGIENAFEYILFEDSVQNMMDTTSFLDGYIEKTNVLIEQKGRNRDLSIAEYLRMSGLKHRIKPTVVQYEQSQNEGIESGVESEKL